VRDASRACLPGAEIVLGSFEDDAALARATAGVQAMLLAGRDGPDAVSQHRRVLEHARRGGVSHIVKLSAVGASASSPIALMREHAEVDELVRRSGARFTLLKPHLYMQNVLRAADAIRRDGVLSGPMGTGRYPLVDTRDVGAAAAVVLADPAAHAGMTHVLTGPRGVTYADVAAAIAVVAGRRVAYEPVEPGAYEERLLAAGLPAWRAFDLAHITAAYSPTDLEVSPTLAALLGREPRSLSAFLADHGAAFRPAHS
jgi:NAD(P)H dehydrogenase (quinone)